MNRIFGLDFLRTTAILLVVFSHALRFAPVAPETQQVLASFMSFMGVELFFTLSGFLIGGILLRENEAGIPAKSIGKFWFRRWMRTLPAYYVVLFGTLLLYTLVYGQSNISLSYIFPYIFFLQNFSHPHPEYFGVAWSLSIEEWFYVLFPLVLWITSCITRAAKSRFFIALFIFLLTGIVMRLVHAPAAEWDSGFRKIVLFRADAVVSGLFMAGLKKYSQQLFARRFLFAFAGIVLLAAAILVFYSCGAVQNRINFFTGQLLLPLTSMGFACLLPLAAGWKKSRFIIPGKFIVFISLISYSLYLVHSPVWEIYLGRFGEVKQGFSQWLIFGGYLAISIVAAALLYYSVEKPFLKLRDRKRVRWRVTSDK